MMELHGIGRAQAPSLKRLQSALLVAGLTASPGLAEAQSTVHLRTLDAVQARQLDPAPSVQTRSLEAVQARQIDPAPTVHLRTLDAVHARHLDPAPVVHLRTLDAVHARHLDPLPGVQAPDKAQRIDASSIRKIVLPNGQDIGMSRDQARS